MKLALVLLAALGVAAAWFLIQPDAPPPPPAAPPASAAGTAPAKVPAEEPLALRRNEDSVEVFRRAFWRDPASTDRILHAERREWISAQDGVRRWQWFLAVAPGPELAAWLQGNPFRLARVAKPAFNASERPAWFPDAPTLAQLEVEQSPEPGMTLAWDRARNVLYATDGGGGFARPSDPTPVAAR